MRFKKYSNLFDLNFNKFIPPDLYVLFKYNI